MKLTTVLRAAKLVPLTLIGLAATVPLHPQTPLSLFSGSSLLGWIQHGGWSVAGGAIASSNDGDRSLFTVVPFGDFDLQFEYNETAPLGATFTMWASRENSGGIVVDLDTTGARNGVGGVEGFSHSSLTKVSASLHRVQIVSSRSTVTVRIDGLSAGSASGVGSKAGYLGFKVSQSGQLTIRSIRITPLNLTDSFNGSDLSGWKSVARGAASKGGITHTTEKVFSFGMAGGSTKPHEAKWTVKSNAIHGESGPGALEYSTPLEDAVIHITAAVKGNVKADNFTSLSVRNTPGQLNTGYGVGIGPYAGTVEHVNKFGFGKAGQPIDETIIVGGRSIATWVGGNLLSVATDSRPEASSTDKGARGQAGTMQLVLPTDSSQIDVTRISAAVLAKPYGLAPRAPAPPQPTVSVAPAAGAASATSAADSAATQTLLKQQQDAQKKDAEEQATKQRASALMGQALASTDPQEQENLYSQVIQIDPSNPNAMQGYKEAQAKLQQQQSASAQAANTENAEKQKEEQSSAALLSAQSAFLGGHLSEASNALSVAERLTPNNPMVRELRSRIRSAQSLRSRLFFLGGGVGLLAIAGGLAAWLRRRKLQRFPVLEITSGIDSGKVFRIEKDETHIGAVPQDAGQKNDIVVRDVEHAISRFHCQVVKRNGQLFLQDLNSSNGTKVDGERLKPGDAALLRKGTRIQLAGTVEMRFGYDRAKSSV